MNAEPARILVVEDNRDTAALLRDLLEAEGYEVDAADTGEAAFETLARTPEFDLLVLDLMLPGMSGYDVIERLRAQPDLSRLPILVLSALSSASSRIRGLREGADDYMTKPFLPEELVARVRNLVTAHLLERRNREMAALAQIAQASLTSSSLETLLARVVESLVSVFEVDAAVLWLFDDSRQRLVGRAAVGLGTGPLGLVVPAGEGLAGLALASPEPVTVPDDAATDPRVTNRALREGGFRSVMAAALTVAGAPIGLVEIAARTRRIDARHERLLGLVADRVAVTVEHARLQGEARELADVVRRIGEGVIVADAEDRVIFANRAFGEMIGSPSADIAGRRWTEWLSTAQDVDALTAQMRQASFRGELLLITSGGEPRPVLLTLSSFGGTEAPGVRRIGVFRDISREHELRFRVIREQKFRTLGSLAAGVAHNINNRLTPVLGWTEMLLERLAAGESVDTEELAHALRVINQGASDSVGTVRRLQEYSRPARVKGPEAVQLRDVVEQLLALTRPQWDNEAARKGIRYELDLRLEPAPPVLAVASEIREALLNVLENALAAMPRGGRLAIHVREIDGRAQVSVTDSGRGMSAEVQRLVFEPFFTTRAQDGGTGLGLPLALEIVQRYGGSIELASEEGRGTTFVLSFPVLPVEAAAAPVFLPVVEPLRVLAVEDEPEVADLLRAMLAHAGHTVVSAASGREALALFEREPVDLVITDLGMPGMTGLVLAAELKQRRPVPIILLTGWAEEVGRGETPEVDVVMAKPFSRERLVEAIARAVPDRVRSD